MSDRFSSDFQGIINILLDTYVRAMAYSFDPNYYLIYIRVLLALTFQKI